MATTNDVLIRSGALSQAVTFNPALTWEMFQPVLVPVVTSLGGSVPDGFLVTVRY